MTLKQTVGKVAANSASACVTALAALHRLPYPLTNETSAAERFAITELLNILNETAKALQRRADDSLRRTTGP